MEETKAAIVSRMVDAYNRRDLDALLAEVAPDALFDRSRSIGPGRGLYRGRTEIQRWLEGFFEAWEEFSWTPQEITELDGDHVLLVNRVRGRGMESGVEVNAIHAQLLKFRGGALVETHLFQSREEALRAFGLVQARLYFVCDALGGGDRARPLLDAGLASGVDIVQLRDRELSDEALIEAAATFRRATDEHGALFILNDRPDLVDACGAHGVHVGQDDAPVAEARRQAGPGAIVGLSTHSPEQLDAACSALGDARPDYLSVGPVWETPTKPGRPATGLDYVRYAAATSTLPWFAIGGIDTANVGEVAAAGAERIVVVRAIRDADDPEAAALALHEALAELPQEVR